MELRAKMLEHLEAALAIAHEIGAGTAGYLIETTLDQVRSEHWPALDPRFDLQRKQK